MPNDFKTEKIVVPIDSVIPNPYNPNYQTPEVFKKEVQSIKDLGMLGSILVRRINHTSAEYQILDGEHRWKAAKELGYTEIPVEAITREVSEQETQLLTILLNNLHGQDDIYKRAKILESLNEGQLQLLPFSQEEIEHEKKFVNFDFSQYEGEGEDIPERKFAQVVVLQMNPEEALVWNRAKESLQERGMISKDKTTKKKADLQLAMFLLKNYLVIVDNKNFDESKSTITLTA